MAFPVLFAQTFSGIGYIGGGSTDGSSYAGWISNINSLVFGTEVTHNLSATLALARESPAAVNSGTRGYWCGGLKANNVEAADYTNEIDGLIFPTEAANNPSATLSVVKRDLAPFSSTVRGYVAGGRSYTLSSTNVIEYLAFSGETRGSLSATLQKARSGIMSGTSNIRGYVFGGYDPTYTGGDTEIDGIRYDTEAAINPSSVLADPYTSGYCLYSPVKTFICGGSNGMDEVTRISTFVFSSETVGTSSAVLSSKRTLGASISSVVAGYLCGGFNYYSTLTATVFGLRFATETYYTTGQSLSSARWRAAGCQWGSP